MKRSAKATQKNQFKIADKNSITDETSKMSQSNSKADASKGVIGVDQFVSGRCNFEVYQEKGWYYSVYLMNTKIASNNNKFYIIQIVKRKTCDHYGLFVRYGRVGETGVISLEFKSAENCKKEYEKKFKAKTAASKGYIAISMKTEEEKEVSKAMSDNSGSTSAASSQPTQYAESKLDKSVKDFVEFIYNEKMMEKAMSSQGYDCKKMPLGDLSEETVKQGYKYLNLIDEILEEQEKTGKKTSKQMEDLNQFSSKFYTLIPHSFGRGPISMHIINNKDKLKQKVDMVSSLIDIQRAFNIQKGNMKMLAGNKREQSGKVVLQPHPTDQKYENLKCGLTPLSSSHPDYKMI